MGPKKVDILQPLFERLKSASPTDYPNAVVYGLPYGYGDNQTPVAVSLVQYKNDESIAFANKCMPFGFGVIGLVEFDDSEDEYDSYSAVEQLDYPVLFKVVDGKITASTGLDYLQVLHLNVLTPESFWEKSVCTFRIRGDFLLASLLELPELENCLRNAKSRVLNQAAYSLGKKGQFTILPRNGDIISELSTMMISYGEKVTELIKALKNEIDESKQSTSNYFRPGISFIDVKILQDQTKSNALKSSTILVTDKSARCKYFEHYLRIDTIVIVPVSMPSDMLYQKFNQAITAQLEIGIFSNIEGQLANSITAELPIVHHFWPSVVQHFVSVVYPEHASEEKLRDLRLELIDLFFVKQARPFFRRSASLFQELIGLVSPHLSLVPKYSQTEVVEGHYEYRHYMQEGFNDDGWGCAYRSLQTIVSWFRLHGFTSNKVPSHKEIQECLVSLGDKPSSFVNSKQWIGSTEVGFVLEALLGVTCRIMSMSSGSEMASRAAELESHFKIHGTPCMVGGGQYAHTIIGVSRDPEKESAVQFLILDPHYTGNDDLKTITSKGWVGWKDNNFWSKTDFYNVCMPLLPSSV